ncbi:uncharacterized protein C15orf39 homolog [Melanotaenia boesemani]|uniref:uncharacterized protein C15orf39 homolog n=1 Tax=Melanotaenia boesemani TaxID=1250792 RepID=UPI001C03CC82|nr:uncharacterized protein C15orf39 homolog [Melanotaenia boesemani]
MSHESMQTVSDPVFKNKMPLFDGTAASTGLSKPQTLSGFLGKQPLQYNTAYFSYDPRAKEGAGFAPPWSNSKKSPLDDRSPVGHLSGMEGQNHTRYQQDRTSSVEGHNPVKQGFTVYTRSPEISNPTVATSVTIRKQKTGAENSSSPSQSSVYLAIPKPVYGHNPCCNELGCVIGQRYSLEHVSPRMPNTIYEHDWMQRAAHYTEKAPIQRKEALLQQRGLQYECGAEQIKRMTVEAYSPNSARTLPPVIEPNYSSYPCTPAHALYGSLTEHSQLLQTSPRGYPSLYTSRPTYEHMTSEVYQERSSMSKYGQLAQHPVFYYSQANGEVENRTQCKDSGSKQGEDVPLLHKHTISNPREHYVVPQWLHAEIPLSCTEMLPNHSFVPGFDYPCYTVPRFNLNASQIRPPLTRQHSSPMFHPTPINVSKSSQHINPSITKDKPNTSLHFEQRHGSSPFLHVEKNNPSRQMNQPALSPSSMQIGRFFHPLTSPHIDKPAPPPAGINVDRLRDYSPFETKVKHPKSLPVSPAAWQPQSPSHNSDRIQSVVPNGPNVRKIIHSPGISTASKQNAFVFNAGTTASKRYLKRSISHSSPPVRIKEEEDDLYEVELDSKRQKLEKDNVKEGTKTNSPPMPVIDNVFSLAPCQQLHLQAPGVLYPSKVPQRATPTSEEKHEDKLKQAIKEKMPDPNHQQSVVCLASKEISPDTPAQNKDDDVFELKNIKVEKVDPSGEDNPADTKNSCSKVIIKKEPEETASSNSGPVLKEKCESDELENKPSFAGENEASEEPKPAELTAQTNSSYQVDTRHKRAVTLQPKCNTPLRSSESKVNFKNIPPHCLKLSTYNIIFPAGKQCKAAPPPEKQSPQPVTVLASRLEPQTPVRKHFFELHHSLCKLLSKCVSASSEQDLKKWWSQLEISEPTPQSSKVQKVSCLLGVKAREVWINEEIKAAFSNVHKRLSEYTVQKRCPFPHVMRAGAVFLPMLVVKEQLFPMVQGSFIDQVLQEHKVELRPTTLSEEKILIQLHKRACSSRLRRLMSLKHLPDIYSDAINLLYYTCVCKHLGLNVDPDSGDQVGGFGVSNLRRNPVFSDIASPTSPSESHHETDPEAQSDLSRNGTKGRVKSSFRHMFPDDTCSDEEEAGDVEMMGYEGVPSTFTRRNCDAYRTGNKGIEHMDSSAASQITISDNSWVCPLTLDELSPSPSDTETEKSSNLLSSNQSAGPQVKSRNCSGMILKLRKMFGKGLNRKKTCYQAVSVPGTFADSSLSQANDGEGVSTKRDLHRTSKLKHRLQRKGSLSRALSNPSKKKVRSLLKIKYCPYLSACHSAEHRKRWVLRSAVQRARKAMRLYYPDLVGKKIRHLYEEDDKSEVWYTGEVLRIHEAHTNPLKTIFEVRYDSEPEWKYYLELLIDYKKGWLKIQD